MLSPPLKRNAGQNDSDLGSAAAFTTRLRRCDMNIVEKIAFSLVGHHLIEVERSDHDWLFRFANDVGLRASCPWRILVEGRIALGNGDHAQKFGLPEPVDGASCGHKLLLNKTIQGVAIRDDTGDLTVTFSEWTALEILNLSCGYEGWQLADGHGLNVVAKGGGEVAIWNS
jgi:hypothetical protein